MRTKFFTIDKRPLPLIDGRIDQQFKIVGVALAIKKGIEIQLWSPGMADPASDCWFVVSLEYRHRFKKNGQSDSDMIITKGEEYYLVRRGLGDTMLVMDATIREAITKAIRAFSEIF